MKVHLFYLSPNTTGGWVTFTAHLIDALEAAGVEVELRKIGNRTEPKRRNFGYGREYRNTSESDTYDLCINETVLIVAAAKKFKAQTDQMMDLGARIVVHDPTELKNLPPVEFMQERVVVIRKNALRYLPDATFIRHPYTRQVEQAPTVKETLCVSTSRIDFDKNTTMLLDANRLLSADRQIDIRGFENRLYTKFKVIPDYPEWVQSVAAYPREKDAAIDILRDALWMADMSVIKGDGGGTQYTFLEAWDAGAVPILHHEWIMPDDDMVPTQNCLVVTSGSDLATILNAYCEHSETFDENARSFMVGKGQEQLELHHPRLIGFQYRDFLGLS